MRGSFFKISIIVFSDRLLNYAVRHRCRNAAFKEMQMKLARIDDDATGGIGCDCLRPAALVFRDPFLQTAMLRCVWWQRDFARFHNRGSWILVLCRENNWHVGGKLQVNCARAGRDPNRHRQHEQLGNKTLRSI
jgi:hypothetical protein